MIKYLLVPSGDFTGDCYVVDDVSTLGSEELFVEDGDKVYKISLVEMERCGWKEKEADVKV